MIGIERGILLWEVERVVDWLWDNRRDRKDRREVLVCRCIRSKFDCQLNEDACTGKNKERGHDDNDGTAVVRYMILPSVFVHISPSFPWESWQFLCSSCLRGGQRHSFSSSLEESKSRTISSNVVFVIIVLEASTAFVSLADIWAIGF